MKNGCVDHFLIATQRPLGRLERLEIWSDCSGFAPEWYYTDSVLTSGTAFCITLFLNCRYCESIRIYDLNTDTSFFFNVQKRFGVTSDLYSHYVVKATNQGDFRIRTPWVYFNVHFGPSHTWNVVDK